MSRIIFFVLIIAVIYFAWRSMRLKQIQLEKRLDKQEKANLAEHKNDMPGEKMVSCANCGLYVPISEAIYSNGKYYCSRQHAMKGPKAHGCDFFLTAGVTKQQFGLPSISTNDRKARRFLFW